MIQITDKEKCSGCTACYSICPKNAISMAEDEEGFLYPKVDESKCIKCGLCTKVCPVLNVKYKELTEYPDAYLCYEEDTNSRINSAAGGAFYSIAKSFLKQEKSIVVGATYDENFNVEHIIVNNLNDLSKLQKSKYVQSNLKDVFKQVQELLKQDYKVLFSGTGCQVAGINSFIQEKYKSNLYCIDLVCYGVPSPMIFKKYLNYQENKYGKIEKVIIRDKKIYKSSFRVGYGMLFENGYKYFEPHGIDPMARLFYGYYCLRPICYNCPFKTIKRNSDLTLGDCWYPEYFIKGFKDKYGITMVLSHSLKGSELLSNCESLITTKVDTEKVVKINGGKLFNSAPKPNDRTAFFEDVKNNKDINELANKYTPIKKDSIGYKIKFLLRDNNLIPKKLDEKMRSKNISKRLKMEIPDSAKREIK